MSADRNHIDGKQNTRRKFLQRILEGSGLILMAGLMVASCDKAEKQADSLEEKRSSADPCSDLSDISEKDIAVREKLGYVKQSPLPDNQCQNCNLYLPPKEGQACGGCMLFKGPVYASAYCTYWAPKV
jgi:hypothetical protein